MCYFISKFKSSDAFMLFYCKPFFNDSCRSGDGAATVVRILYQNYFIIFAVFLGVSQNSLLKIVKRLIYYYGMNSFGFRSRQIKDKLYFLFELEKYKLKKYYLTNMTFLKLIFLFDNMDEEYICLLFTCS